MTSLLSSTTQIFVPSRRGSRQMRHSVSSETLPHCVQNLTRSLTVRTASTRLAAISESDCRIWNAIRKDGNILIKQIYHSIKNQEEMQKLKDDEIIKPELERRKNELERKRDLSQPIRMDQIMEHQKKYYEELRQKQYERNKLKMDLEIQYKQNITKFPKSQAQIRIEEIQKQEKERRIHQLDIKKLKRQRQEFYVEAVKQLIPLSHIRHQESSENNHVSPIRPNSLPPIRKLQSPQAFKVEDFQNLNIQGFLSESSNLKKLEKALSQLPQHNKTDFSISLSQDHEDLIESDNQVMKRRTRRRQNNFSLKERTQDQSPNQQQQTKVKDYLKEQRFLRASNEKGVQSSEEQWKKIMKDETLPANERYQSILFSVQKLEQKALQKEQLGAYNNDPRADEEANKLYIDSIKAKLVLLQK